MVRAMHKTTAHQLIEARLNRDLALYVRHRRAEGLGWRRISHDLKRDTGVTVSHEALRTWFAPSTPDAAAA